MNNKQDLKSYTLTELRKIFEENGIKPFRANQVFEWIHNKNINIIEDISVLSKKLKSRIDNKYYIENIKILERYDSKLDGTKKYLFCLNDGNIIESVLMPYRHGNTACISTQVGCKMGCKFCASTKEGLIRNLSAGEIVDQIYKIQADQKIKVNNIVLMGSGEPLDNYDNVIKFLKIVHDELGINLGYRHITLSTCGLVPKIYDLANEELPITLSISLHATTDIQRKNIMPIANKYSLDEIIKACKYYINKTNRRITFEYTLINGVNDNKKDALKMYSLIKGMLCHVNLIPLNNIKEVEYKKSNNINIKGFADTLCQKGISTTVRREMGSDINAACGQLRNKYISQNQG
ncbi:23S rRNA (adenine(2503)-C(2))-methyltransferase RlmN [Abyssisolibacter fermentans]|uniref:23S rRNA (adenine(2503)-C(2))-methyltransferase RlmN n=1 Tax=Abyssisolibacter fermentans TaxID=1766203 RepID=UPI00082EA2BF|nr:23S rRNA (adenine(2503)-C(2))-methyltransferase RlmN [Abyssisolibacter fermentans]